MRCLVVKTKFHVSLYTVNQLSAWNHQSFVALLPCLRRAMYNGIGLTTPRGSGTNGYVQRNLSTLRVKRPRDERGGERDEKDRERLESQLNRQPNADILEHQRKRQLEVKCAELQDMMEEQGYEKESLKVLVTEQMLLATETARSQDPRICMLCTDCKWPWRDSIWFLSGILRRRSKRRWTVSVWCCRKRRNQLPTPQRDPRKSNAAETETDWLYVFREKQTTWSNELNKMLGRWSGTEQSSELIEQQSCL